MNGNEKTVDFLDSMASQSAALPETTEQVETVETKDEAPQGETPPAATPEVEQVATPPVVTPKEPTMVPLAGLQDEREKRQKAEAERQRLEKELEQYRKQEQAKPVTDFYLNPEQHVAEVVSQVEQRATQRIYSALEAEARIAFPDYDEVFTEVEEYAKTNPAIAQQVLNAPNPARKAYEIGKQLREYKEMQNPEAYKAKLEAELRAKWEAELAEKQAAADREAAARQDKIDAIPPDLSKTPSATAETRERRSPVFNQLFDKPS